MSKAVMISIRPKWCEMIVSRKKTVEVRKDRPRLEPPFKCYIYCTKPRYPFEDFICYDTADGAVGFYGGGKVIGEFICDTFVVDKTFGHDPLFNGAACMTEVECAAYSCCSPLYGWHISNRKIYDTPKDLREFALNRPPQSWCYV